MQRMRERPPIAPVFMGLLLMVLPHLSLIDMFTNQRAPYGVELVASFLFFLLGASLIVAYAYRIAGAHSEVEAAGLRSKPTEHP